MNAYVTRDSVSAGDDLDPPHAETIPLRGTAIEDLVLAVIRGYPLPKIQGGRATWCLSSKVPLAVIAQEWRTPKLLFLPHQLSTLDYRDGTLRLHFSYLSQRDPEVVLDVVRNLRLTAIG